jgi:ADP-heptose:LPS heptosyltransferase
LKILVIKLGALGDVVMATALLRAIRQHHPDDQIHLLTTPGFAPLFEASDDIRLKSFPRKGAALQTLGWIRSEKFDRIYDLQSNDRSAVLCALSGARERVGNHPRYPYTHHPVDKYRGQCHIFARMNQVLASAGIPAASQQPFLPASTMDQQYVQDWLKEHRLTESRPVLMHAGASTNWPSKRWQGYQTLAQKLDEKNIPTIWLGAGEDGSLNRQYSQSVGVDATNIFSIIQLAELGRQSRCAVVNDSGPMHILSASGIPVYAFFGPTSWKRNHALGQESHVLCAAVSCSPCSLGQCPPDRAHQCMTELSVDYVYSRLEQALLCG